MLDRSPASIWKKSSIQVGRKTIVWFEYVVKIYSLGTSSLQLDASRRIAQSIPALQMISQKCPMILHRSNETPEDFVSNNLGYLSSIRSISTYLRSTLHQGLNLLPKLIKSKEEIIKRQHDTLRPRNRSCLI